MDTQLQRYVAIKLLHADLQSDPSFKMRFQREARVIASLRHPNIVQIFDFQMTQAGEAENAVFYMVMDYIEGQTLGNYIASTSRVGKYPSATDLIHLFTPISMAVDYAHQKGMLHRDIKPANILLDKRPASSWLHPNFHNSMGEPILTDFGIAKLLATSTNTLSTGGWQGTPHYTSPEQAKGVAGNERSDLYSLGVILYEICTGVRPFSGENVAAILMQHIHATPASPALINPALPPALTMVIMRSLAKDPTDRFPSAVAMIVALADALNVPVPEVLRQPASQSSYIDVPTDPGPLPSSQARRTIAFSSERSHVRDLLITYFTRMGSPNWLTAP